MLIQNKKLFWFIDIISGTPTGPFINTIHFASFVALYIPLVLGIWVGKIDFHIKDCKFGKAKSMLYKFIIFIKNSIIYLLPALLMIFALFKSLSRGAMLAFCTSMFIFVLLIAFKSKTRLRAIILLVFTFSFLALTFYVDSFNIKSKILSLTNSQGENAIFNQDITERISTLKHPLQTDSAKTRFSVWRDTLKIFSDFPLFGTGLNTFSIIFPKYKTIYGSGKMFFTHSENDYVETLSEVGLLGIIPILLILIIFLRNTFINFKLETDSLKIGIISGGIASVFALLFCALTDFSFHIPSVSFIFMLICFVIWPKTKKRKIISFNDMVGRKKPIAIVVLLFLVAIFMFIFSVQLLLGEIYFYKFNYSQDSFQVKQNYIKKAVFFNNGNAEYRYSLGKIYFDQATLLRNKDEAAALELIKQAKTEFEKAIILQPTHWKYHFFNGSAELILVSSRVKGYSFNNAESSFEKALSLNPTEYDIYGYLANYYLPFDSEKAFKYYRKLIMLRPYYLGSILDTIWKINNNPDFIREAIPSTPRLIAQYADFLKSKGINSAKFYKESAFLASPSAKNKEDQLAIAQKLALSNGFKDAFDYFLDSLQSSSFFQKNKEQFIIPTYSSEQLIKEEENVSTLQKTLSPDDPQLTYKLALFHYQLKDYNKASEYFMKLLKISPNNPFLRFHLAMALYKRGEHKEAYEELRQAITLINDR
ncbi:MAG: O-antigen ligase family protein [Candidatus Omnitrophota bacterium]